MVGREVRKYYDQHFQGTPWYLGMVTSVDEEVGWYTVRYVDGDIEDIFPTTLRRILLPEPEGSKPYLWDEELHKYKWEPKVVCSQHWKDFAIRYSALGEVYIPPQRVNKVHESDLLSLIIKAREPLPGDSPYKEQLKDGAAYLLEVFDTGAKGWGVRALEDIPPKVAVIEYAGEVVNRKESRKREPKYYAESEHEGTYIFDLHLSTAGRSYVVDATKVGNAARFINHGCGSLGNLEPLDFHPCPSWPKKLNLPSRIALVSTRAIKKGEELLYDYFESFHEKNPNSAIRVVECKCGSSACRGRIF